MNPVFRKVGRVNPGRSVFNLSYEKKLTADFGKLYPVMCDEVVPGDIFKIGNEIVIRFLPLVAPILYEINVFVHYYFVPYRLLWNTTPDTDSWEAFITGGPAGTLTPTLPLWDPTRTTAGGLWDYLGLPMDTSTPRVVIDPDGVRPVDFPRRAYNFIYNEYYRDETLVNKVALTNEDILIRSWAKDYFTSCLPWQQRGTAPAFPITGIVDVDWDSNSVNIPLLWPGTDTNSLINLQGSRTGAIPGPAGQPRPRDVDTKDVLEAGAGTLDTADLNTSGTVDLGGATTFNVADVRLAFQIQKFLERNARAGVRYVEFLGAHFGVNPRDDRLQRPEYIGGSKSPIIISEVLQTSQTGTTPQGNMAGHGISVDREYIGKYRATEFGLIMGIMSVMPVSLYQQGVNRQWIKETKYDYYFPEFAHLSEQAVLRGEIYANTTLADNKTIFGYQGRYDELRTKQNMVVGDMRDIFDYWHMSRQFSSFPQLNQNFLECVARPDCFATTTGDKMIVSFGNRIKAIRPLPFMSDPGFIDH